MLARIVSLRSRGLLWGNISQETSKLVRSFCASITPQDFSKIDLNPKTEAKLKARGFQGLFPVQIETFGPARKGEDLIVRERTGSGKTIAYTLPVLEKMREENLFDNKTRGRAPKVLIMSPTRELAIQVYKEVVSLQNTPFEFDSACVYGGQPIFEQARALNDGVDVLVATPGRLQDMVRQNMVDLTQLHTVILDETDEILKVGFKKELDFLLELAFTQNKIRKPQMLLFSATIPNWIHTDCVKWTKKTPQYLDMIKTNGLKIPDSVKMYSKRTGGSPQEQISYVPSIIEEFAPGDKKTIVFVNYKHLARKLASSRALKKVGALHGDMNQNQRERTFQNFKTGAVHTLVATDVAARGLDFPSVDLVIHIGAPQNVESFVHRSGRTGRAGKPGVAFLLHSFEDDKILREINYEVKVDFHDSDVKPSDLSIDVGYSGQNSMNNTRPGRDGMYSYRISFASPLSCSRASEVKAYVRQQFPSIDLPVVYVARGTVFVKTDSELQALEEEAIESIMVEQIPNQEFPQSYYERRSSDSNQQRNNRNYSQGGYQSNYSSNSSYSRNGYSRRYFSSIPLCI